MGSVLIRNDEGRGIGFGGRNLLEAELPDALTANSSFSFWRDRSSGS